MGIKERGGKLSVTWIPQYSTLWFVPYGLFCIVCAIVLDIFGKGILLNKSAKYVCTAEAKFHLGVARFDCGAKFRHAEVKSFFSGIWHHNFSTGPSQTSMSSGQLQLLQKRAEISIL